MLTTLVIVIYLSADCCYGPCFFGIVCFVTLSMTYMCVSFLVMK